MTYAGQIAPRHARGWAGARIRQTGSFDACVAVAGLAALGLWVASAIMSPTVMSETHTDERTVARDGIENPSPTRSARREHLIGGYGGVTYTMPSAVRVNNPDVTDFTTSGFEWIGRPFKAPIYYGVRTQHWLPEAMTGSMVDFTHAKAIAVADDVAQFSGKLDGQTLPPSGQVRDVFKHLEFSHGHNMLTLNGLLRMPSSWLPMRPYFGLGGGVSLPHSEVGLHSAPSRTYEYQFAGFVGQGLVGIQIPLGRVSLFFEYKFSYAPYSVPLSQEPNGHLLVTDLWKQFRAWMSGEKPPGGTLTTTLSTHHAISGIMVHAIPGRTAQ